MQGRHVKEDKRSNYLYFLEVKIVFGYEPLKYLFDLKEIIFCVISIVNTFFSFLKLEHAFFYKIVRQ